MTSFSNRKCILWGRKKASQCLWRKPSRSSQHLWPQTMLTGALKEALGVTWIKCGIFHYSYILKAYRFQKWNQFMHKTSALRAWSFSGLPLGGNLGYKALWLDQNILHHVDRGASIYSSPHGDLQHVHQSLCEFWAPKCLRRYAKSFSPWHSSRQNLRDIRGWHIYTEFAVS